MTLHPFFYDKRHSRLIQSTCSEDAIGDYLASEKSGLFFLLIFIRNP